MLCFVSTRVIYLLLSLGDSRLIEPGQTILSIGNPLGYRVKRKPEELSPQSGNWNLGTVGLMVQVAIPIEAGSSGSPVVNRSGEVIALLSIKSGGAMGFDTYHLSRLPH